MNISLSAYYSMTFLAADTLLTQAVLKLMTISGWHFNIQIWEGGEHPKIQHKTMFFLGNKLSNVF